MCAVTAYRSSLSFAAVCKDVLLATVLKVFMVCFVVNLTFVHTELFWCIRSEVIKLPCFCICMRKNSCDGYTVVMHEKEKV